MGARALPPFSESPPDPSDLGALQRLQLLRQAKLLLPQEGTPHFQSPARPLNPPPPPPPPTKDNPSHGRFSIFKDFILQKKKYMKNFNIKNKE